MAASIALTFLAILGGTGDSPPLNITWFLQADTSDIDGAKDITQWTFFRICGSKKSGDMTINSDCEGPKMSPLGAWDKNADGLPSTLSG